MVDPKEILDAAREDFRSGRYAESLKNYEYFFDHALDDDPASYYGVRLSYCLNEWVRLGKKYPEARQRLEDKAEESLRLLDKTRNAEKFHDYVKISDYLKRDGQPVATFLGYHQSDPELAESIVRFVWDKLVQGGHWSVCSGYVKDAESSYANALQRFDEAMQVSKDNPQFGGEEFDDQVRGWYFNDVSRLLLVLKQSGRSIEFHKIHALSLSDMSTRSYPEWAEKISAVAL